MLAMFCGARSAAIEADISSFFRFESSGGIGNWLEATHVAYDQLERELNTSKASTGHHGTSNALSRHVDVFY